MTRTWIAALMAATALVPAIASAQDGPRGRGGRGQAEGFQPRDGGVQPQREDVEQRAPRPDRQRPDRQPQFQGQSQRQDQAQQDRQWQEAWGNTNVRPGDWIGTGDRDLDRRGDRGRRDTPPSLSPDGRAQTGGDPVRDFGRDGRGPDRGADRYRGDRGQRYGQGYARPDGQDYRQQRQQWGQQRDRGNADWRDQYRGQQGFAERRAWNRGWRQDDRYDYGSYRNANRGAYRMPRYYAPSGWGAGYRRFGIGVTLNQSLWGQNYWIDDADDYRLPQAYGPYRWVRYYNDALLVDIRNGRVVDSVYDLFW